MLRSSLDGPSINGAGELLPWPDCCECRLLGAIPETGVDVRDEPFVGGSGEVAANKVENDGLDRWYV